MLCCLDITGGSLAKTSTSCFRKSAIVDFCVHQPNVLISNELIRTSHASLHLAKYGWYILPSEPLTC